MSDRRAMPMWRKLTLSFKSPIILWSSAPHHARSKAPRPMIGNVQVKKMIEFYSFSAYMVLMSFVTAIVYVVDKFRSKNGTWRISEKSLLLSSFSGGAIGGYVAMLIVRHKTKKWYFHFVNLVGIFWQVGLFLYLMMSALG